MYAYALSLRLGVASPRFSWLFRSCGKHAIFLFLPLHGFYCNGPYRRRTFTVWAVVNHLYGMTLVRVICVKDRLSICKFVMGPCVDDIWRDNQALSEDIAFRLPWSIWRFINPVFAWYHVYELIDLNTISYKSTQGHRLDIAEDLCRFTSNTSVGKGPVDNKDVALCSDMPWTPRSRSLHSLAQMYRLSRELVLSRVGYVVWGLWSSALFCVQLKYTPWGWYFEQLKRRVH